MYAVVRTGGKQYRVAAADVILVEKLAAEPGATIELDQVLMLDDGSGPTLGAPLVEGASVAATVLDQTRGEKILVFKKKRRKNHRRLNGHRQDLTALRITEIRAGGTARPRRAARAAAPAPSPETAAPAAQPGAAPGENEETG